MAPTGRCGRVKRSSLQSLSLSGRWRSARLPVFSSPGLIFVFLSASAWLTAALFFRYFLTFLAAVFLTFFFHSSALCVYASPAVCSPQRLLITLLTRASKGANKKVKNAFLSTQLYLPTAFKLLKPTVTICIKHHFFHNSANITLYRWNLLCLL